MIVEPSCVCTASPITVFTSTMSLICSMERPSGSRWDAFPLQPLFCFFLPAAFAAASIISPTRMETMHRAAAQTPRAAKSAVTRISLHSVRPSPASSPSAAAQIPPANIAVAPASSSPARICSAITSQSAAFSTARAAGQLCRFFSRPAFGKPRIGIFSRTFALQRFRRCGLRASARRRLRQTESGRRPTLRGYPPSPERTKSR